jgi:hypothetical protein
MIYAVEMTSDGMTHTYQVSWQFSNSRNIKGITSTVSGCIVFILLMSNLLCLPLSWPQMAWYIHTKFHEGWYRQSSSVEVLPPNWRGCSVGITDERDCEGHCWDRLKWHDTHTKCREDWCRCSSNIKVLSNLNGCNVCIMKGIYEVCGWDGIRWHSIQRTFHEDWYRCSSNIKICLSSLKGYNVIITNRRHVWIMPLQWAQVSWYMYQVPLQPVQAFK